MPESNVVEIPLSKKKIALMLAGSLAFVAIGLWFVIAPPDFRNQFWADRAGMAGIAAIVVFGLFAVFAFRKLGDRNAGLTIHDRGLVDNAGAIPAGEIPWDDVVAIEGYEMNGQHFVTVHVRNPQQYIARQTSAFKRKIMEMNAQMVGTPISISANSLQIRFEELLSLLQSRLDAHRRGNAR